ncbi:VOC family protein [Oricola indica]|uniref:VOC family protein n=1 Tax=Oricola indica TaxID=2872591 RepID=UPI003CCBA57E
MTDDMTDKSPNHRIDCRGIEHVGLTVPSLDQAIEFFARVFGFEKVYELGPFRGDDWMRSQLNVPRGTVMRRLAFLRCANGPNLELFEYETTEQAAFPPRNSDIGGHHLAFYVDDFDAALDCLRHNEVEVLGDPVARDSGPSGGQSWIYFLTPWGLQCELVSYPTGKAYERQGGRRLWQPAPT